MVIRSCCAFSPLVKVEKEQHERITARLPALGAAVELGLGLRVAGSRWRWRRWRRWSRWGEGVPVVGGAGESLWWVAVGWGEVGLG